MRALVVRGLAGLVAVALAVAGLAGAYGYAQDYNLHRGFATIVPFRRAGTGRLQEVHFYSAALHRSADYLVYLPPGYRSGRRYPVYYLLHGMPGQPRVFVDIANMDVRLDNQMSLGRARPMILVYPDGRIGGSTFSDSEWANTPSGHFESYVIDVMHNVDQRFSTIPRRQDRVIAGFSAGAYGAMNIALHHLRDFADVQAWSGYYLQTRTGVFAGASRATLAANSPLLDLARVRGQLRRYPLRVLMFVGRADSSAAQQAPMARALVALGVPVRDAVYPGGHDWSVWYPRLNTMLDLASRATLTPPRLGLAPSRAAAPTAPSGASTLLQTPTPRPARSATPTLRPAPAHHGHRRHRRSELRLLFALMLALVCAGLINIGFVLQQRGHERAQRRGRTGLAAAFAEPVWLLGQAVGWAGFAGQIVAVALAPLTLVQAFSAGGLALSVPLAARVFGHRVSRRQLGAIALIALGLAVLPLGYGARRGYLQPGLLIAATLGVLLVGGLLSRRRGAVWLAVMAGIFYGTADGAIKAASLGIRHHGVGMFTGWALLAGVCTFGGFMTFQGALRRGDPVRSLSLMNALTALMAIGVGVLAFGERLGRGPLTSVLHLLAIGVVLLCVRPLAGAQQQLSGLAPEPEPEAPEPDLARVLQAPRAPFSVSVGSLGRTAVLSLLTGLWLVLGALVTVGLLYELRQLRLMGIGPQIPDALSLLQLAGFAAQPLARVLLAGLLGGLVLGLGLIRIERSRRAVLVGVPALALLLLGSDAAFALAHNLRFAPIALHRTPGMGAWLEALCLTAGAALPGTWSGLTLPRIGSRTVSQRTVAVLVVGGLLAAAVIATVTPAGRADARAPVATARQGAAPAGVAPANLRSRPPGSGRAARAEAAVVSHPGSAPLAVLLDRRLRAASRRSGAPALSAAVLQCGRTVWADAAGVSQLAPPRRATAATLFVFNSALKTVIATMVMQQVDAGHLRLSTRLASFFPRLPNAREITVRMLLDMTSGLPDYLDDPSVRWLLEHRPRHRWTVAELLRSVGAPAFAPGRRYQYSDTNYIVLGAILTRITHSPIQPLFERFIARPLGITSATFVPTPAAVARLAHPYFLRRGGVRRSLWIPGFGVSTATWGPVFTDGGLAGTTVDLARIVNALFAGRLVSSTALAEMTHLGAGHYGLGLQRRLFDGREWLGHLGAFGGYEAQDWTDPARQLTIAVAADADRHGGGLISTPVWRELALAVERSPQLPRACPTVRPSGPTPRAA